MTEATSPSAILELQGVEVAALRDPSLVVLEEVTWSVRAGEFWVVAGSHHSGKSDLLLHAAGLLAPGGGSCRLFGGDPNEFDEARMAARLRAGFVFAGENLFGELTLAENLALPLLYQGKLAEADVARRVAALLELVELTPQAGALPGGVAAVWRRRAVLARALALQPELLFLDNPDGGLPARHRQWLIRFLDQLWRGHPLFGGQPMTLVVATDELQHWQHPQRQFAGVAGGRFEVLGAWGGEAFRDHPAVKELLTLPEGTGEGGAGPQETVREWPSPADAMTPPPK